MEKDKILAALNLIRKLPPSKIHYNANYIANLMPDQAENLMQRIDKPLEIEKDPQNGNEYIKCEFNRDGDSYRSFWTNKYYPPLEEAEYPSKHIRELEEKANILFQEYAKLYYQGGVPSIYFWDKEDKGFACAFLMYKEVEKQKGIEKGTWNTVNVIDIKEDDKKKITFKITSSIILEMAIKDNKAGDVNISGSLTKAKEEIFSAEHEKDMDSFYLEKIGRLVEDMESYLRSHLDTIYVGKTKENIFTLRSIDGSISLEKAKQSLAGQLINLKRQDKNTNE